MSATERFLVKVLTRNVIILCIAVGAFVIFLAFEYIKLTMTVAPMFNESLALLRSDLVGKCIRVNGWSFPAQITDISWSADYSPVMRSIQEYLKNSDARKLTITAKSVADGEETKLSVIINPDNFRRLVTLVECNN